MDNESRNILIHTFVMIIITIGFMGYFSAVEKNEKMQNQIDENISIVPIGQLLAYEGYFGYSLLRTIRYMQEKPKGKTKLPKIKVIGYAVYEYVIRMTDLIGITIITFEFFIYGYPMASPNALSIVRIADLMYITVLPSLGLASFFLLRIQKSKNQ